MVDSIITYEKLYEILRKEKYLSDLQKLDEDFFESIINYINEKKEIIETQKTQSNIFALTETQKIKRQIENIQKIIKEIYNRRESKIIQLAILCSRTKEKIDLSIILPEEKKLFESILEILNNYREGILTNLLSQKLPKTIKPKELKTPEESEKNKLIRFIQTLPKFVDKDLNIYGPFEAEDIASLPIKIADILIKKNKAKTL